jgi:hypothetical protein
MKQINITGRQPNITKLMEKNVMGNDVKSTTKVKINKINNNNKQIIADHFDIRQQQKHQEHNNSTVQFFVLTC